MPVECNVFAEKVPSLPPRGNRIGTTASDEEFKAIKEVLRPLDKKNKHAKQ